MATKTTSKTSGAAKSKRTSTPPPAKVESTLTVATPIKRDPTHDEIAFRAFELYERGGDGGELNHWLAAERELRAS